MIIAFALLQFLLSASGSLRDLMLEKHKIHQEKYLAREAERQERITEEEKKTRIAEEEEKEWEALQMNRLAAMALPSDEPTHSSGSDTENTKDEGLQTPPSQFEEEEEVRVPIPEMQNQLLSDNCFSDLHFRHFVEQYLARHLPSEEGLKKLIEDEILR